MAENKNGRVDLLKTINDFSGSLTWVTIVIAIVLFFSGFKYDVKSLLDAQAEVKEIHKTRSLNIAFIKESLKDKDRDHQEFHKKVDRVEKNQVNLEQVINRLDFTLKVLNDKLDKIK